MKDDRESRNSGAQTGEEPIPAVTVTWTGSLYRIVDPQLAITVEETDLAAGYAKLREIRAEAMRNLSEAGVPLPNGSGKSPPPKAAPPRAAPPGVFPPSNGGGASGPLSLQRIVLSFALVGFAVILGYQLLVAPVLQRIDRIALAVENVDPYAHTRDASRALARLADLVQQITPERRKELRENLRIIVRELRPLTLELVPLFDPAVAPPPAVEPGGSDRLQPPAPDRNEQP